jgi:hypothetical protein
MAGFNGKNQVHTSGFRKPVAVFPFSSCSQILKSKSAGSFQKLLELRRRAFQELQEGYQESPPERVEDV